MPVARNVTDSFTYVLKEDRALPEAQRSTFHLRTLTTRMHGRLRKLDLADISEATLRLGVAGWDNFNDADGAPVECKHERTARAGDRLADVGLLLEEGAQVLSVESLNRIPARFLDELTMAVLRGNALTDDDVGK
jgi:hypothetical protein